MWLKTRDVKLKHLSVHGRSLFPQPTHVLSVCVFCMQVPGKSRRRCWSVPVTTGTELGSTAEQEVSYLLSHLPSSSEYSLEWRFLKFIMAHVQRNMPGFSRKNRLIWNLVLYSQLMVSCKQLAGTGKVRVLLCWISFLSPGLHPLAWLV